MKFPAKALLLGLLFASAAAAQIVPISGNVRDVTGTIVTTNVEVDFELQNYGSMIPSVSGSGTLVLLMKPFKPDASGNIHCTGTGCTDTLYTNASINPLGTFYSMCIIIKGRTLRCNNYLVNTAFSLSALPAPLNVTPNVGPGQLITQCQSFLQATPATTWTFTHNENDPNVYLQTTDLSGNEVYPDSANVGNPNVAVVTWIQAQAGRAKACTSGSINIATNQPNAIVSNPIAPQTITGTQPLNIGVPTAFTATIGPVVGASALLPATQGGYIGWNQIGGIGEMDFFDQKGLGSGGFKFWDWLSPTATLLLTIPNTPVGNVVGDTGTQTLTNKTLASPIIAGGIAQGGGLKHQRGGGCTTAASVGASCTVTVTWTTPFNDTNYTVVCAPDSVGVIGFNLSNKAAASVNVNIYAITAVAATSVATYCIAVHDPT